MFCQKCGSKVEDGAKFCTKCGTPVAQNPARSRETAGYRDNTEIRNSREMQNSMRNMDVEKVFGVKEKVLRILVAFIVSFTVGAIFAFYEYSQLSEYFYQDERRMYFIFGLIFAVIAVEQVIILIAHSKKKLYVGKNGISGINAEMLFPKEFSYSYNEITEIRSTRGTLQFLVNGKWVKIGDIEDQEVAKRMIEERIAQN